MLGCRLVLPFGWECLDQAPSAEAREAAAAANAGVVRFLLHETDLSAASHPGDERLVEALTPIRIKLDTVIEMLGRLSYRDTALPPRRSLELSLDRIAWRAPAPLPVGAWLRTRLYFHPTFLEPVALHGQVAFCGEADGDAGCPVQAELDAMPDAAGEAFIRLAFLAQRRQLAEHPAPHPAKPAS